MTLNRQQRRAVARKNGKNTINRDEAARRTMNPQGPRALQPGEVMVTQTDLLAQIGQLTVENTILRNQLEQAGQHIAQLTQTQVEAEVAKHRAGIDEASAAAGGVPVEHAVEREPTPIREAAENLAAAEDAFAGAVEAEAPPEA